MQPIVIAPSILSANFAKLGAEVDAALAAFARRDRRFGGVRHAEPVPQGA